MFFLVVTPGFENLAVTELNEKIPGVEILSVEKGGVTVQAPLALGLAFNSNLKIPTLILLRIAEFKCRDLPRLFQKTSNVRWGRYLLGDRFALSVSSSKSRLQNEKKISGTVSEGIARHFVKQPPKKLDADAASGEPFEILVRFFDDVCTFSLNLSGEALYKRGYKGLQMPLVRGDSTKGASSPVVTSENIAVAPIRENLAAALFYALWCETGGVATLIDPMCGSGTFLFEAQNFWQPVLTRGYAYQDRKEWVATQLELGDLNNKTPLQLVGFDKNEKVLQFLREYLPRVRVAVFDIFSEATLPLVTPISQTPAGAVTTSRLAFICNPPYGERLRLSERPDLYYAKLINKMLSYNPIAVGIIIPKRFSKLVSKRFTNYFVSREIQFENGGIPVEYRIYK